MTTTKTSIKDVALIAGLTILSIGGFVSLAHADTPKFSFRSVEYLPRDQREAAAQAFVADNITAGMPVAAAVMVLRQAGAYCPAGQAGAVVCTHSSMERHPGQGLADVTWKVRLTPSADGAVTAATVTRTKAGF